MIENFFFNFSETPEQYLEKLFSATDAKGEIAIARYEDELSFHTCENVAEATWTEHVIMRWRKADVPLIWAEYTALVDEIKRIADQGDQKAFDSIDSRFGNGRFARRIAYHTVRLHTFFKLGAPESVINKESCMLLDAIALDRFAERSSDDWSKETENQCAKKST